jgi:hypothetical protein
VGAAVIRAFPVVPAVLVQVVLLPDTAVPVRDTADLLPDSVVVAVPVAEEPQAELLRQRAERPSE